jgi:hypothetical protein
MEEVNEGWIEVMTTNKNGPNELNSKEIFLNVQLSKIMVMMHSH